jgi:hypothetical protein
MNHSMHRTSRRSTFLKCSVSAFVIAHSAASHVALPVTAHAALPVAAQATLQAAAQAHFPPPSEGGGRVSKGDSPGRGVGGALGASEADMRVGISTYILALSPQASGDDAPAARDVVLRRGGLDAVRGEIKLIDAAGVLIEVASAAQATNAAARSMTVPWHAVRDVDSERQNEAWLSHKAAAEQLWRAVIRVERGDPALAESHLERLFEQYRGQTNETALVVAEGLLRCRLARAANELAVLPWLEAARIRSADVTTAAYAGLDNVIDADTLLCPRLAPAWPTSSRLEWLRDALSKYDAQDDPVIAALAALYGQFARVALGSATEPMAQSLPKYPGVHVLAQILALRSGDVGADATAIDRAVRRAADWPAWAQAWMRYHLGRALMNQSDRPANDLGLVQLAYIPARHRAAQPYLAGLALHDMATALESHGDDEKAGTLRRLVYERYPGHPAADTVVKRERTPEPKARPK